MTGIENRMKAFHSDPAIKAAYLARVEAHRQADRLVQGYGYWSDGRGCAPAAPPGGPAPGSGRVGAR